MAFNSHVFLWKPPVKLQLFKGNPVTPDLYSLRMVLRAGSYSADVKAALAGQSDPVNLLQKPGVFCGRRFGSLGTVVSLSRFGEEPQMHLT